MKTVSIVIPAYNEEKFISQLLTKIKSVATETEGFVKEIIVVDDGSKDRTAELARQHQGVKVFIQNPNQGKGAAVQRGIREATGEFVLVQDADLEYDPDDYIPMLRELNRGPANLAIYGSRVLGQVRKTGRYGKIEGQSWGPFFASAILTLWTFLLFGRWITDTLTGYKIYPTPFLKSLTVKTAGFETDHELTSKLIRHGYKIREVPVSYVPRSLAEGKKIKMSDGLKAVWTLLRFRIVS